MAYQYSEIVNKVRRRAKNAAFDELLLLDAFDELNKDLLTENHYDFMEAEEDPTIQKGEYSIELGDDVLVPISMSAKTNDTGAVIDLRNRYVDSRQFFDSHPLPESAVDTAPSFWTLYGRQILFTGPMDADYTILFRYIKAPTDATSSTQIPPIPKPFDTLYLRAGLAAVEEFRGNYDIAALHRRKIEDYTQQLKDARQLKQFMVVTKEATSRVKYERL